jgi:hypothetical protein
MTLNTNDTPEITEPAAFRSLDGAYSDHETLCPGTAVLLTVGG